MAKILGIGIATLDIINTVEGYPAENYEVRALSQRRCRGGNCANTLAILQQMGHKCAFAGILATDPDGECITQQLKQQGISVNYCRTVRGKTPTSYVTVDRATGSRTIVHYRDLVEFSFVDFLKIDLSTFDWIHFEGRNIVETERMLEFARERYPSLPRSVEIEKPRSGIESLFSRASVLLFSHHYVTHLGYSEAQTFLHTLPPLPNTEKICAWGEKGAYALDYGRQIHHVPAFPPPQVIDTLGAGDTFNAGFIDARLRSYTLYESLTLACQLAGRKCGQQGLDSLFGLEQQ